MKPPILTDKQIQDWVEHQDVNDVICLDVVGIAQCAQRDKDYEHEQRTVREIFEEMEKRWKQYKYPLIAGTRKEETYFIFCSDNPEWAEFKSRFLEKVNVQDNPPDSSH